MAKEPEPGYAFRPDANEFESFKIGGDDSEICNAAWLNGIEHGEHAADVLARRIDAFLTLWLNASTVHGDDLTAEADGWEVDPRYGDNDGPHEDLPADAFERIDVFTLDCPETLEPSAAQLALTKAVRAGDPNATRQALADGADADVMADDNKTPLCRSFWPDRYKADGEYTNASRDRQLTVLDALLVGGASPDCGGREYAAPPRRSSGTSTRTS